MLLHKALDLPAHALVAAVGAGGKTTTLQRLAAELTAQGACVLMTTTTAIWHPGGLVVLGDTTEALLAAAAQHVAVGRTITLAAKRVNEFDANTGRPHHKLFGVPPDAPARLLALPGIDYVLVEADGARNRSIKAPAEHEPVIPLQTTHVLALVGMEALGEPITDVIAHRPERICALLDLTPATPLSPRHIAALLAHPSGGRKGVPASACYIPFLNKVQDDVLLRGARAVMAHVRGLPGIERVLIGAALSLQPVLEVWQ